MPISNTIMLNYIQEHDTSFDFLMKSIKKQGLANHVPIIKDDTLLYLIQLLQIQRPKQILELGSGLAYSTYTFAKHSPPNAEITSIDISKETIERCQSVLSISKHINKITWIHSDALAFLKASPLHYDLYFIDALKSDYFNYYETIKKRATGSYIIVFDNLYMDGKVLNPEDKKGMRMHQFNKQLFIHEPNFTFLPIGDGLGIYVHHQD